MSTANVFRSTESLIVTTRGPGKLTLLTYGGATGLSSVVGAKSTTNSGQTRWLISFSHNYTKFAFIWEGSGEAVYRVGYSLLTTPVGTKWTSASLVDWGQAGVKSADVSANLAGAVNRDDVTTFWIIPDPI